MKLRKVASVLSALQWKPAAWSAAREEVCYLQTSQASESWLALIEPLVNLLTLRGWWIKSHLVCTMLTVCVCMCVYCIRWLQNGHLECVRWMVSETEAIAELSCTREHPSLIHYAARYGQVTHTHTRTLKKSTCMKCRFFFLVGAQTAAIQ